MCFSHQVQLIFEHTDQWKASVPVLPRLPALITRGYQSRSLRISSDTWCTVKRLQISSENHLHSNYGGTGSVFIQACRGLELRDELAVKCKSAMLQWVRPHCFVLAEDLITRTQLIYHREQEIQFPTRKKKSPQRNHNPKSTTGKCIFIFIFHFAFIGNKPATNMFQEQKPRATYFILV